MLNIILLWSISMIKNKGQIILGGLILAVATAILVIASFINQPQDVRSRAQEASPTPTSTCQTPGGVQNVRIDYPYCQGSSCSSSQASCSWDAVSGAVSYTVKVTEIDTGTIVKNNQIVTSPPLTIVFSINNGKTYQCDAAATNACGTSGQIGTDQRLCQAQVVATPTPSAIPTIGPTATTVTNAPTVTPAPNVPAAVIIVPTSTPRPIIVAPGAETTVALGTVGVLITIISIALFFMSGL